MDRLSESDMKIMVTGASGLLGASVASALVATGREVHDVAAPPCSDGWCP